MTFGMINLLYVVAIAGGIYYALCHIKVQTTPPYEECDCCEDSCKTCDDRMWHESQDN